VTHWLLEVELGGRVFYFSDEALTALGANYAPGLDDIEATIAGDVSPSMAVTISPAAGIDWAKLASVQGDIGGGVGTLYRWDEGATVRRPFLSGVVLEPEFGAVDEALTFTLSRPTWLEAATVPEASHVISPTTWPIATNDAESASDLGASYPLIIGTPSRTAPSGRLVGGSKAVVASVGTTPSTIRGSDVIVADGHVVATTATVLWESDDGDVSEALPLFSAYDSLNNPVTKVDWATAAGVLPTPSGGYRIHWSSGGGVPSEVSPGAAMTSLAEVIPYLLRRGAVPVDTGRQAAAGLERYRVDVAITEPVQAESWIREHFVGPIGLYRRDSADGQSWHEWPVLATSTTAGVHLIADTHGAGYAVRRTSSVRWSSVADIANRIAVEYAMTDGKPTRRVVVAGDTTGGAVQSQACAWSLGRYGDRPRTVALAWCYDDATAGLVATRLARMSALPTATLTVEGDLELEAVVQLGDVVALTDAGLYWTARLCMVREIRLSLSTVVLVLETIANPGNVRDRGTA
jgi:hypothetical protein